jgi:hypothetical protein
MEGRERRLVEPAQNQLLLARVVIDVADRENPGNAGLEFLSVHLECFLLELEPPFGHRAELGMQPKKREHLVGGNLVGRLSIVGLHDHPGELRRSVGVPLAVDRRRVPLEKLHFAGGDQLAHAGHGRGRRTKFRTTMHQGQRARLAAQGNRPIERGIAAPANHQIAAVEFGRALDAVMDALAFEFLDAGQN